MPRGYFITGIDTGVGKTWVTLALMRYFSLRGESVIGMKPVAAGCELINGQLKNSDALLLQAYSSVALDYQQVNPYAYALPVSPHIAGVDNPVDLTVVQQQLTTLQGMADKVVVEGAGGWYSPLSLQLDNATLAKALNLPVVLVVAIRLGCINQACLSLQAIRQSGVDCAGWVAVCNDPAMQAKPANIDYLKTVLDASLLGVMPYLNVIDIDLLTAGLNKDIS
ncbi:MAG: dethiobiotin synthase [Methylococcaceae bacterium]|nr:dethiobiotin synthase [Methylococcaceae bacterium]